MWLKSSLIVNVADCYSVCWSDQVRKSLQHLKIAELICCGTHTSTHIRQVNYSLFCFWHLYCTIVASEIPSTA